MKQTQDILKFTRAAGIELPVICGAMYPCSNPELIAAVSAAGGLGVIQPISLTYVHGYDFREGIRSIRQRTDKPIGMNALIERSSKKYHERMVQWVDIALEEGIRFFVTSLGKPNWVVERVHSAQGIVYHDVTERKWAMKALDAQVDGLIAVNNRAGGHAGAKSPQQLFDELGDLGQPLICAGGVSTADDYLNMLRLGYAGVQMGTRFIATHECNASDAYKQAIINAEEEDIVLSERITGVPVSVIRTAYVQRTGTHAGWLARQLLSHNRSKAIMRTLFALRSLWQLKQASLDRTGRKDYWQAGKSVAGIAQILPVETILQSFRAVTPR